MILFFGPPGSGKSVQGELLVKRNNWLWLSTGQLFRNSKNPEIHKRLATGELFDDELTKHFRALIQKQLLYSTDIHGTLIKHAGYLTIYQTTVGKLIA
jgi:adenylate kinase family enzyme